MVPVAFRASGINGTKQFLNLGVGKGGDEFSGWSWNLYPVKGVVLDYTLGDKPGEKDSQAAQVAVDGVSGQPPVLDMVEAVIRETPLLLKMENKGPDFMLTDLSYICTLSFGNEKVLKVTHTADDNSCSIWAFAFSGSAKLVTMK